MSIRSRIIINNLAAMLVLNALSITAGFLLFWFAASPFVGDRLTDNAAYVAARYFPLGGVAALIMTGIGAFWIIGVTARRVTGPLTRLKKAATEIRDGNLGYEMAVTGHDEFTELAAGFEQMRIRLRNSMRLQERAETERRAMMASVTHDLKTPITSIIGYAEGILDGVADTPERIKDYAEVIRKKARSLQVLSEDLSLLSLLESAGLPMNKQDEDLGELAYEVAEEFSCDWRQGCKWEHKGTVLLCSNGTQENRPLVFQIEPGLRVKIDREKMARVLVNLLQNSVKYKKPEQTEPEISLTLVSRGNEALLTVSDNGVGITQNDLPNVFSQFYRADASRSIQSGSGLGLSIARHIVQLHDGKIWIVNNPGGGISVNISLPLIGAD